MPLTDRLKEERPIFFEVITPQLAAGYFDKNNYAAKTGQKKKRERFGEVLVQAMLPLGQRNYRPLLLFRTL